MALSDDEQTELLTKVRYIADQLGPSDPSWGANSSLGKDDQGNELTFRDGMAELKRYVEKLPAEPGSVTTAPPTGGMICQISRWLDASKPTGQATSA